MADSQTSTPFTARWCWVRKHAVQPWNQYVYFRRVVDLPAKPSEATIRISADSRYTLYVNGARIHQGPARSFPVAQVFDVLDLASHLRAGRNTICAIVHQFGIPTFFSVYRDISGFLLDGAIAMEGSSIRIDTSHDWLCREAGGWRKNVARLSIQLGFQEHFDADEDPSNWMSADYDASEEAGWQKPVDLGPVGCHPWVSPIPRPVPLLTDQVQPFIAVGAQFSGENARGYKVAEDVYHIPLSEERKREKGLLEHPEAMLKDDAALTTVPPPPDGQFMMAVLDLGQIRTGHFMLDIAEAAGDEIIDILYTEELDKSGAPLLLGAEGPTFCREATADRYRCRAGAQRWEAFHMKGFRYATLIFRNIDQPLKIRRVAMRHVHADVPEVGRFECSDPLLTQIWQVGRETQRNCMFDAYVDCPWREQAMWWGDARVQFKVNAYTFGDVSLFERGIRLVAQSQSLDGSLHSHPPADFPLHRLPDFMLTWVSTLWDYYYHTGRTELLRDCLPVLHRVMDFFKQHEVADGLIGNFDGFWVFLDWSPLHKSNFSAPLNLMYLQALRHAAALCDLMRETTYASTYIAKAAKLTTACEKYFWDGKNKSWRDGFDPEKGEPIQSVSQHTVALALLLRLRPESHPLLAREVLIKPALSRKSKVITASPFFYANVLDALAQSNFREEVVQIIREKWGAMIESGATAFWEIWEPTKESRCHAWSASPVYHLSQQVLGVSPVNIGWEHVRIAPLAMDLEYARGTVPTPHGPIKIDWEKSAEDQLVVHVEIPEGITAEFVSPLGETRNLPAGVHEFHT